MLLATLFSPANRLSHAIQLPSSTAPTIVGARSLALSPNGDSLAFCYRGDVWVVSASGGLARRVTDNVEMDDYPVWSPDGKYIAFASNRNGSMNMYVVSEEGGPATRLTFYSGTQIPTSWTPDGKKVLFSDRRDDPNSAIFSVDVQTGATTRYFRDMMSLSNPQMSVDGKAIYYERMGFPWFRPRYHGSGASQLWEYDLASKKRTQIERDEFQHLWPQVGPGGVGVACVTADKLTPSSTPLGKTPVRWIDDVDRTPNVYWYRNSGKTRLTSLVGYEGARFLTVASKASTLAYETGGDIFVEDLTGGQPVTHKLVVRAPIDDKSVTVQSQVSTTGATEAAISPKNTEFAFVLNNDIWTVPVKKGTGPNKDDATQITHWAGLDSSPVWLPDNKKVAFISDRDNVLRAYVQDVSTQTAVPIGDGKHDVSALQLSPKGDFLSYWESGSDGGLFIAPVSGGPSKRIIDQSRTTTRAAIGQAYSWSPDEKYVAYLQQLQGSGFYYWDDAQNVMITEVATGDVHQVTDLGAHSGNPVFSPDGKYLFYSSDRDGPGVYALPLKLEDAREVDLELKYQKPTAPVNVSIDWNDIASRSRKIWDGEVMSQMWVDPESGDIYFQTGTGIQKIDFTGKSPSTIAGVTGFMPAPDNGSLIGIRNGLPTQVEIHKQGQPVTDDAIRCAYDVDINAEHLAAFDQFWRNYNNNFYDPNFHGRDWYAIKQRYMPLLSSIGHRNDIATLLNEMVGELESSHSEVGPAAGNPAIHPCAQLGFLIDYAYSGPGLRIASIPENSPGSYPKTALKSGDIVQSINGTPVSANESLWKVLTDQSGRDATLVVKSEGVDKPRSVTYRLMSAGEWNALLYRNRIDARRKYVEAHSGGKVTYVQIPGMDPTSLKRFEEEAWQFTGGKKALIIDVRNNGGGNTGDQIMDILKRTPYANYRERDMPPVQAPGQTLHVPLVVMCAETSYSNAEMFPAAAQDAKVAKLVGMPTPGYVIWTYGQPLVDGTVARMPSSGSYRLDGTPLEDVGVTPDYVVDITPEQYLAGKDPQLDEAIKLLLSESK